MTLYEANFIKLNQLIACLQDRCGHHLSYSDSDCTLHLAIEARTKYTCEIRLTYLFDAMDSSDCSWERIADPNLVAKVFFDARMAEVQCWIHSARHELLRSPERHIHSEIDRRWMRNIMLSKWLDYLLDKGHFFPKTQCLRA